MKYFIPTVRKIQFLIIFAFNYRLLLIECINMLRLLMAFDIVGINNMLNPSYSSVITFVDILVVNYRPIL